MIEAANSIHVGMDVPAVSADALFPDGAIKELTLQGYRGKWVVIFFYPLDFTFVCPTEIRGFNACYSEFQKLGAEVIGASTDSAYCHKAWVENGLGAVRFPLLADTNHKASRSFNVLLEDKGIALRGTFIIDPEGILRSALVNDVSVGRNVEETLRTLQALQTGELTGCGWKPGEKTLSA